MIRQLSLEELKKLYGEQMKKDFPAGELRPYSSMKQLHQKGHYDAYGMVEDGQVSAYACLLKTDDSTISILDYYAVNEKLRDQGLGSKFLQEFAQMIDMDLIIEVEDPAYAESDEQKNQQERRIHFYQKNGAQLTDLNLYLFIVHYRLMIITKGDYPENSDNYDERIEQFYKQAYRPFKNVACKVTRRI